MHSLRAGGNDPLKGKGCPTTSYMPLFHRGGERIEQPRKEKDQHSSEKTQSGETSRMNLKEFDNQDCAYKLSLARYDLLILDNMRLLKRDTMYGIPKVCKKRRKTAKTYRSHSKNECPVQTQFLVKLVKATEILKQAHSRRQFYFTRLLPYDGKH